MLKSFVLRTYELSTHSTTHAPFRALEYFKNDITIFCFELSSYVLEIELQIKPAAPFSDLSWESSQLDLLSAM